MFGSEYLNYQKVSPTICVAKSFVSFLNLNQANPPPKVSVLHKVTNALTKDINKIGNALTGQDVIQDKNGTQENNKDEKTKDDVDEDDTTLTVAVADDSNSNIDVNYENGSQLSREAQESVMLHFKHAPTSLYGISAHLSKEREEKIKAKEKGKEEKEKEKEKDKHNNNKHGNEIKNIGNEIERTFEKIGDWFKDVGNKIEKEAKSLKHEVFDAWKEFESDLYEEMGEPTYYEYYLCTQQDTIKVGNGDLAFANRHAADNIYYVSSLIGEYPWHDYKQMVVNLMKQDEKQAMN